MKYPGLVDAALKLVRLGHKIDDICPNLWDMNPSHRAAVDTWISTWEEDIPWARLLWEDRDSDWPTPEKRYAEMVRILAGGDTHR